MIFFSKLVNKLKDSLVNHPNDWESSAFTIKHKYSGVELWVSDGLLLFEIYRGHDINIFEKAYLYHDSCKIKYNLTKDYISEDSDCYKFMNHKNKNN